MEDIGYSINSELIWFRRLFWSKHLDKKHPETLPAFAEEIHKPEGQEDISFKSQAIPGNLRRFLNKMVELKVLKEAHKIPIRGKIISTYYVDRLKHFGLSLESEEFKLGYFEIREFVGTLLPEYYNEDNQRYFNSLLQKHKNTLKSLYQ